MAHEKTVDDPLAHAANLARAATRLQHEAVAVRIARNDAIRTASTAGVPKEAVARACGISGALVRRIVKGTEQ
ncbi:hypothetical protein RDV89_00915 [Nocardioides zeae]|uniref:Helix-turn-helix DNA binding domain protein n=1 Tax=Nocardioides imazamoxiresistens TaxID=3231893 RepID=A0ABU3PQW5_9ACTN|nr:hypothetical protein [Nocardioides zeae]MDT9591607.1 hypothetical protein [Nocardioides zeae]